MGRKEAKNHQIRRGEKKLDGPLGEGGSSCRVGEDEGDYIRVRLGDQGPHGGIQ